MGDVEQAVLKNMQDKAKRLRGDKKGDLDTISDLLCDFIIIFTALTREVELLRVQHGDWKGKLAVSLPICVTVITLALKYM